jgi:hypothetical protein
LGLEGGMRAASAEHQGFIPRAEGKQNPNRGPSPGEASNRI